MIHNVEAGGDLQAALNAAQPGDTVSLQAGATFIGNFTLPAKPDGERITVQSNATLPDRRLTPTDISLLPTIKSGNGAPALTGDANSKNWLLDGLKFDVNEPGAGNIIELQNVAHIIMDRLYISAPETGQKRAIMGNGQHITLKRSHIAGIWTSGQDSQAFCAWDGAGPYTVVDNFLEAAGENVMFGGANSQSEAHIPSDIIVENNHLFKRLDWRGKPRSVKNLFELKSAKRVVVRNNTFENNWTDAQNGFSILFTPRNDEGQSPWSCVEDVLFENNTVKGERGLNISGFDVYHPSMGLKRVIVRNNTWETESNFFQLSGEVNDVTISDNQVKNGWLFGLLYHADVWPSSEPELTERRPTKFCADKLVLERNTGFKFAKWDMNGAILGEGAGFETKCFNEPTPQHPNGHTPVFTWEGNVIVEAGDPAPIPPDPEPEPPQPIPFTVTCKPETCVYTLTDSPPDESGGWKWQIRRDSKVYTAMREPPWIRSVTAPSGTHMFQSIWIKAGQPNVVRTKQVTCD